MKFLKDIFKFLKKTGNTEDKKEAINIDESDLEEDVSNVEEAAQEIVLPSEYIKSRNIINSNFLELKFFEIGDLPSSERPKFIQKYIGGVMDTGGGLLTLGICLKDNGDFLYKKDDVIALMYAENGKSYMVTAMIESTRELREDDFDKLNSFKFDSKYKENIKRFFDIDKPSNFIVANILITADSKKHQRRQHIRLTANWTVHFKIKNPNDELTTVQKKWIAERIFDTHFDYFKLTTVDISEGGFKTLIKTQIPQGTQIECIIEIDNGKAKLDEAIIGQVIACSPDNIQTEYFDTRVQFTEMSDSVRAILAQSILANIPTPVSAEPILIISNNGLVATIKIKPPKNDGADLSYDDLKEFLAKNKIVYGIDDDILHSLANKPVYDREIIVARGVSSKNGSDAELIYYVEMERQLKPKEKEDGTVDFKELGTIQDVDKNTLLCEKKPLTGGIPGTDVMGNRIIPIPGKDRVMPAGKNTVLSDDKLKLLAAVSGQISIIAGKINVVNTFTVQGNVSTETGNINFVGNVVVRGDVMQGFSVQASGDVIVDGVVEVARIMAGGSLVIRGGFRGGETGILDIGGYAACLFIEGGEVTVKGNLQTTYILNSTVKCSNAVNLVGKGLIRGSYVTARTSVTANYLGSANMLPASTVIEVGSDPSLIKYFEALAKEIEPYEKNIAVRTLLVNSLTKSKETGGLTSEKEETLAKESEQLERMQLMYAGLKEEYGILEKQITELGYGTINVYKSAYAGVKIIIGAESLLLQVEHPYVSFSRYDIGITFTSVR